jgi:uncharacterized membrane protein
MPPDPTPDGATPVPTADPPAGDRTKPHPVHRFRNTFATGLVVVVPLVATLWLLSVSLQAIHHVTQQVFGFLIPRPAFLPEDRFFSDLVHNSIPILILVGAIFAAGVFATHAIGSRVLQVFDWLVLRVPLVSTIYSAVKQVLETLRGFDGNPSFKSVVYVDYPAPGCRLIGFVTGRYQDPSLEKPVVTVFLPTSPNPLTGFVVAVDADRVRDSRLSVEEATKLVVSAGLVSPTPPGAVPAVAPRGRPKRDARPSSVVSPPSAP